MALTGWIHYARDLRDERATVNAMAARLNPAVLHRDVVRLARRAAFAHRGSAGGYADWRHPERPDPDLAVVIDGQLSNRRDLEEQLYQRARPLSSDAEVLLHSYRVWGTGLVDHIEGAYAITLWDNQARHLLLICDPLGAKTLFYTPVDGGLLFATRTTAMLAHPDVEPVVDTDGFNELLALGPVRTPGHGVLHGVKEVLPGELIRITPDGLSRRRYRYLAADDHDTDPGTAAQVVRRALAESATAARTRPAGAVLLSGGIASAAAAVFTAGNRGHRPGAWTLTLAGPDTPSPGVGADVAEAARTAELLRMRHTVLTVGAHTLFDTAAAARTALDLPGRIGTDATLLAVLQRIAAAGTTSVVTGDGAAAVCSAYPWLHNPLALASDDFPWNGTGTPAGLLNADARRHLMPGVYRRQRFDEATLVMPHRSGTDTFARRRRTMAYLTLTRYLPHLLIRLDQLAEQAGLTVHTPFADWPLMHYLFNMPDAARHRLGIPHRLLRHAVAGLLPAAATGLPSRPFPTAHILGGWQQTRSVQLQAILGDPDAPLRALLDRRRITDLLAQPPTRLPEHVPPTVAYLVEVNAWLRRHHISLT